MMKLLTNKQVFKAYIDTFADPSKAQLQSSVNTFFHESADINVIHPFNKVMGGEAYLDLFLESLLRSFDGLYRRDYIMMGGEHEGDDWVSSTGYYVGHFKNDWLGIKATNMLAYLRVGEFHRMVEGKAVESFIFLDIPELMIAAKQWPISDSPGMERGYTAYLPGPATQDGLLVGLQNPAESEKSYKIVTDMLSKLATKDEGWRPYWHKNMLWYGPAAFGSFIGVENFAGFQVTFENAFDGWAGGSAKSGRTKHFVRHGDGDYSCSGGWPSLSGVQVKTFMGQAATNEMLYMRVCDWWRREGDLLVENWVFVDIPHVLLQMGFDLFADVDIENV